MSAKSILEADGKAILNYHLTRAPVIKPTPLPPSATHNAPSRLASLHFPANEEIKTVLDNAEVKYPWLLQSGSKFVAKPDQLIKRRGKSGLLCLNKTWPECREWIEARATKTQRVETVDGVLRQFLVEPFVPHSQDTEYYINIHSVRDVSIYISFCFGGGGGGGCLGRKHIPDAARKTRSRNLGSVTAKVSNNFSGSRISAIFMLVILAPSATRFDQRNIRGLASGEKTDPKHAQSIRRSTLLSHGLFPGVKLGRMKGTTLGPTATLAASFHLSLSHAKHARVPASDHWIRYPRFLSRPRLGR